MLSLKPSKSCQFRIIRAMFLPPVWPNKNWRALIIHYQCSPKKAWPSMWIKTQRCSRVGCRKRTLTKRKEKNKQTPNSKQRLRAERTSFISPLVVLAARLSPFLRLEKSSQNTASTSRNKLFAHARVRWNSLERREFSLCVSPGRNAQRAFQTKAQTDLHKVCEKPEKESSGSGSVECIHNRQVFH